MKNKNLQKDSINTVLKEYISNTNIYEETDEENYVLCLVCQKKIKTTPKDGKFPLERHSQTDSHKKI